MVFVLFPLIWSRWPGADQAHVSDEDIETLGQFVNAPVPDLLTDARLVRSVRIDFVPDDPGIKLELEHPSVSNPVLRHELLLAFLRVRIHAADLVHIKALSVLPDPLGFIQDRSGRRLLQRNSDNSHSQERKKTEHQAAKDIHRALQKQLGRRSHGDACSQDIPVCNSFHFLHTAVLDLDQLQMNSNAHLPALLHQLFSHLASAGDGDIDLFDPFPTDIVRCVFDPGNYRNRSNARRIPGFTGFFRFLRLHLILLFEEDHSADMDRVLRMVPEVLNGFFSNLFIADEQDLALPAVFCRILTHETLVDHPGTVTDENIDSEMNPQRNTGDGFAVLHCEKKDRRESEDKH